MHRSTLAHPPKEIRVLFPPQSGRLLQAPDPVNCEMDDRAEDQVEPSRERQESHSSINRQAQCCQTAVSAEGRTGDHPGVSAFPRAAAASRSRSGRAWE
jgi:hypothetical protein